MAALTGPRNTDMIDDFVIPRTMAIPMAAATTIFAGSIVATNAAGYAVPASTATTLRIWGRAKNTVVNTGAVGAMTIELDRGTFPWDVNADTTLTRANIGALVYATDDHTISTTATGRSLAGMLIDIVGTQAIVITGAGPQTSGGTLGG